MCAMVCVARTSNAYLLIFIAHVRFRMYFIYSLSKWCMNQIESVPRKIFANYSQIDQTHIHFVSIYHIHSHTAACKQTNIRVQFVERYRSFSVDLFKYISVCRVDRSYELSRNCNVFIVASNALILRFFVLHIEWKIPLYWHTHTYTCYLGI